MIGGGRLFLRAMEGEAAVGQEPGEQARESTPSRPGPVPISILVCDDVYQDGLSQKKTLLGLFNTIGSTDFPATHDNVTVFLMLTNGHGRYDGTLRFKNESSGKEVFSMTRAIEFADPLAVVELSIHIGTLFLPEPGIYLFEFLIDDKPIAYRKIRVSKAGVAGEGGE